jgi:long-chain acyl-CoA synthetase
MQVIDQKDRPLPAGQIGEICVQGPNVMEGYLNQPKATAETLRNGWLHTGDLGYIDEQGYVFLTGLKKRMVHVGGRNVYPDELERMLRTHPNVERLELSWSDSPLTGAKINARISLKKRSVDEQKSFMQWAIQNIAAYKLPKQWDFV